MTLYIIELSRDKGKTWRPSISHFPYDNEDECAREVQHIIQYKQMLQKKAESQDNVIEIEDTEGNPKLVKARRPILIPYDVRYRKLDDDSDKTLLEWWREHKG